MAGPRPSKEKAWIPLDPLVRIEPFQRVALTPRPFLILPAGGAGRRRGGPGALHWNRDHGKNIPYVSISRNNFLFTPARRLHERRSRRSRTRKPADIELAIAARVGIGGILPPLPPPGSAAYVGPPPCGLPRPSPGRDCAARFSAVIDRKPPIHEPSAANTT
jgi:hypothetical protein